jgi:hypothetical protein
MMSDKSFSMMRHFIAQSSSSMMVFSKPSIPLAAASFALASAAFAFAAAAAAATSPGGAIPAAAWFERTARAAASWLIGTIAGA